MIPQLKKIWVAIGIVFLVAVGGWFTPVGHKLFGNIGSASNFYSLILDAGITETGGANTVNVLQGTTITNNLIQGSAGYSLTISSANIAGQTLTAAQFCAGAGVLIPQTSTTSITITYPSAAAAFTACGAVPGGWSEQWIDNESSFPVTIATSTSSGINFYVASTTGLAKVPVQYPPVIAASSTQRIEGMFTDATHLNMYTELYQKAY